MSAGEGFLWWDLSGCGEGICGSRDAAWLIAARGMDAASLANLRVTVQEAHTALTGDLEVVWEPTGRTWSGRPAAAGGVVWESVIPK